MNELKKVGTLTADKEYNIMKWTEGDFNLEHNGRLEIFPVEQRCILLCQPLENIHTYRDKNGLHYVCPIGQYMKIDLFSDDKESLFNLISSFLEVENEDDEEELEPDYICPECGELFESVFNQTCRFRFCPNCGAETRV